MPRTTIYVKDTDIPIVERAKKELGESLSQIFVECLQKRLEKLDIKPGEMEKIVLEFWDPNQPGIFKKIFKKSFQGRWLLHDVEPEGQEGSGVWWDHNFRYSVAITGKGNLVLYTTDTREEHGPDMKTYDSPDALIEDSDEVPPNVRAMIATEFGKDFEIEMDI